MTKNIKALINDEKYDEAAEMIIQGLATLLTSHIPMLEVSAADIKKCGAALITLLQGSEEDEEESTTSEKTDAPGDDIELAPAKAALTLEFVGPEDDAEFAKMAPVNLKKYYAVGAKYFYSAPDVSGYTVDPKKASGEMIPDGVTITFTYTADDASDEEETTQTDTNSNGGSNSGTEGSGSGGSTSSETTGGGATNSGTETAGAGAGEVSGDGAEIPG